MIVDTLKSEVVKILKDLGIETPEATFEHPAKLSHGDYSTNVALSYAKQLEKKPRELAEQIVRYIELNKPGFVEKVEIAGPGFINFHLSKEFFGESVSSILRQAQDAGKNKIFSGRKVMVEFTDPNPFKEFHIGHLMSNAVGESVARIFEFHKAKVLRACWQGDVGLHVAKAIWGMQQKIKKLNVDVSSESITDWGEVYALGSEKYESDEIAKKEINILNKIIFEKSDNEVQKLYLAGRRVSLEHFEEIYELLDTKFNYYFFESIEGRDGQKVVEANIGKVFEKSEGAIVYKGEKKGLHTRVFINSQGLPTYEAKELGLNKAKFRKEPDIDTSIIVTANEQSDYFKVILAVMAEVLPKIAKRTKHLAHGMLRFAAGKMSSRKGNVIRGEDLIGRIEGMVLEKMGFREFSLEERKEISKIVAIGAIKYSILRQAIGGDIIFDFDKSISFEGDSGPYLQYSYVRAQSVLEKAKNIGIEPPVDIRCLQDWKTTSLERMLYRFPEVVERAGSEYAPHYVTHYLTELAGIFNGWYAQGKIVDATDPTSPYKLALTSAFAIVMKNGLHLLGIKVPERM